MELVNAALYFIVYIASAILLWGITKQTVTGVISQYQKLFPPLGEIMPSAFGFRQYFLNFGETISNTDLNASFCLYIQHVN